MKLQVSRSILIEASKEEVWPYLAELDRWQSWSPWSVLEPNHKTELTGEMGAVGSCMAWDGELIGSGNLTLARAADSRLDYSLVFLTPWKSKAQTAFELAREGDACRVTWLMDSSLPFFLFFMRGTMQSMIGMDYDRGLTMLKDVIESGNVDAETTSKGLQDFSGFSYVGLSRTTTVQRMPEVMSADFEQLMSECVKQNIEPAHVLSVYDKVKFAKQEFSFTSAVSDESFDIDASSNEMTRGQINSQKMLEIQHRGPYRFLGNAWSMGHMILRGKKLKANGSPFEYYHNDPSETAEQDLLTSVFFPVKA